MQVAPSYQQTMLRIMQQKSAGSCDKGHIARKCRIEMHWEPTPSVYALRTLGGRPPPCLFCQSCHSAFDVLSNIRAICRMRLTVLRRRLQRQHQRLVLRDVREP